MRVTRLDGAAKNVMNYWLMKTEPSTFSWDDLVRDGQAEWTGVRNYAARNFMQAMHVGGKVFIYHSNEGKEIVGIAAVSKLAHPDSTDTTGVWHCVNVIPVNKLKRAVSLEEIKKISECKQMKLVTHSRLSVQPVTPKEWEIIIKQSET